MNHDLMAVYAASEIVELLTLCQELQSEKDGRERPAPGAYSRDEDAFAERIRSACGHALLLRRLLPVTTTLSAIGAEMERRGEISVLPGEDYAQKALARLTVQYSPPGAINNDTGNTRPGRFIFGRAAAGGHRLPGRAGPATDGARSGRAA